MANPARPTEIKLHLDEFDGTCTKSNHWLKNVTAYLTVNPLIFSDDEKKIALALSFMTQGAAATWSEDFMDHAYSLNPASNADIALQTPYGYGTWADFVTDFRKAFSPVDVQGTAMAQLMNLHQGRRILPSTSLNSISLPFVPR